jgi:hypothetical protein
VFIVIYNFPNMDAGIAFSFLVNAETTKKYVGSRCLAQETQVSYTSSLLHFLFCWSIFLIFLFLFSFFSFFLFFFSNNTTDLNTISIIFR